MIDGRFLAGLLALAALGGLAAWPLVDHLEGGPAGLAAGLAFSVLSLGLGHHWVRWSARRAPGRFVGAVMGAFAARVVALVVFALGLAFGTGVDVTVALVTVVASHLTLGALELVYLKRTDALG
ncbi:MAG: hypothetical protein ACREK7_06160 [Gemmatimonadota bacterium]